MLTELFKAIEKWQLPVIVGLGGLLFLYLSFFAGLPAPGNAWTPPLRTPPHYGLLTIGCVLIASAIIMALLPTLRSELPESPGRPSSAIAKNQSPPPDKSQTENAVGANLDPVVVKYWRLPATQKEIVVFFYEHSHKPHVPMDTLFKALLAQNGPEFLKSEDELFYRLKALRVDGFLELNALAHKETDVVKVDAVRKALGAADIINT